MSETVLIQFSGPDQPGLTAALTAILSSYDACVLDIGQAVIHETLVLGLLIEIPADNFLRLQSTLVAKSGDLRLQVSFTPVTKTELEHWIHSQGKDRFIITILGRAISANHLARVSAIIAEHGLNVDRIERLSGRLSLAVHTSKSNACVELRASGNATSEASMRAALLATAQICESTSPFSMRASSVATVASLPSTWIPH